jgi:hypothetical protein
MRAGCFVVVWLLTSGIASGAAAGRLQDVEDTADPPEPRPARAASRSSSGSSGGGSSSDDSASSGDYGSDDDDDGDGLFGRMLMHVLLAPWTLPHAAVDNPCYGGFAAYPYAEGPGQLRLQLERPECTPGRDADGKPALLDLGNATRAVAAQFDMEAGYVLGSIVGGSVAARVQLPHRFEFDGRVSWWSDMTARPHEQALAGTLHAAVRFAQARHVAFRTGVGLRAFGLHGTLLGVDVLYGVDIFGKRPIMAHIELHGGTLKKALAAEARLTLGVQIWKLELYAGYDHNMFASNGRVTRLGGPVAGLRAWF